jgi:hypothetical protein
MARLMWDSPGSHHFETGIDRGVLYTKNDIGVPWNGLTAVNENSGTGSTRAYFLDGLKYLEVPGKDDFAGSIEAFTYPDEFSYHDGSLEFYPGLLVNQQRRRPFSFSYRTRVGDEIKGAELGYKLHLVYKALAKPSDRQYTSLSSSTEAQKLTWDFSTTPTRPRGVAVAPLSHVVLDSRKVNPNLLRFIEEHLYGTDRSGPQLMPLDDIFTLFANPQLVLRIVNNPLTGLNQLSLQASQGDLFGDIKAGLYQLLSESRLVKTTKDGFYRLDTDG